MWLRLLGGCRPSREAPQNGGGGNLTHRACARQGQQLLFQDRSGTKRSCCPSGLRASDAHAERAVRGNLRPPHQPRVSLKVTPSLPHQFRSAACFPPPRSAVEPSERGSKEWCVQGRGGRYRNRRSAGWQSSPRRGREGGAFSKHSNGR